MVVYSRNGKEFSGRFSGIWDALRDLPAKSAIIDAKSLAHRAGPCADPQACSKSVGRAADAYRSPTSSALQRSLSLRSREM